jgi:hypothetical protein
MGWEQPGETGEKRSTEERKGDRIKFAKKDAVKQR